MKSAFRSVTFLGLVTVFGLALLSANVSARSYGYRHHHYGFHGFTYGGSSRARMVQTLGN